MTRPKNADVWDGISLERDDTLSEKERKKIEERTRKDMEKLSAKIKKQNSK